MSTFKDFANEVRKRFNMMAKEGPLFVTNISKKEVVYYYQEVFPPGTNEIFRENKEHDCNTCNKFISRIGRVVKIVDSELMTVWGVGDKLSGTYKVVADEMDALIKEQTISQIFLMNPDDAQVGVKSNIEDLTTPRVGHDSSKDPTGIDHITWNHFSCKVPSSFLSADKGTLIGDASATREVFKRGLEELSLAAMEITLDLIDSNSIYRGEEFRAIVEKFCEYKKAYESLSSDREKEFYVWLNYTGMASKIRGTAIGTLLIDLSEGMELNDAVASYEKKVAPENYKRTSSPITKRMIDKAIKKIDDLGLRDALERRYARLEDVSVNNVIHVNREAVKVMKDGLKAMLNDEVKEKPGKFDNAEEISAKDFIEKIVPKSSNIEVKLSNMHENNLMSLIAPVHADAPTLFKWDNNFSWTYNGNTADSMMKQRVKSAGGNIDAYLRFSIQWNENNDNQNDFDAHVREPKGGTHIYYPNKGRIHPSSGHLDVDIINPGPNVAVENITYTNPSKMPEGEYKLFVHNYYQRGGTSGFRAEIEFGGVIHKFSYDKKFPSQANATVAVISYSREHGLKIVKSLPHDKTSKKIWGIKTEKFHKVNAIMYSPNHWDGQGVGNKHVFFMLDKCENDGKARGFYNEFLCNNLNTHRKVFEVLGGKMKCEESSNQVSGLGFSTTKRESVIVRTNNPNRILKVKF
jgi:hypothetical protein